MHLSLEFRMKLRIIFMKKGNFDGIRSLPPACKRVARRVGGLKIEKLPKIGKERNLGNLLNKEQSNSQSFKSLPIHSDTFESELTKLESLSSRNLKARYDWLEVQKKLIQFDPKTQVNHLKYPRRYSQDP
jgi:hypothetical protein